MSEQNVAADKIADGVEKLVQAIQANAPMVWEASVRAQTIEAWTNIATFVLGCLVLYALVRVLLWSMRLDRDHRFYDVSEPIGVITGLSGGILAILLTCALLFGSDTIVGKLLNPEWAAIQAVAELVK